MKYFKSSERTSHTISRGNSLHNVPGNSRQAGSMSSPMDLRPRCASCGKGRRR